VIVAPCRQPAMTNLPGNAKRVAPVQARNSAGKTLAAKCATPGFVLAAPRRCSPGRRPSDILQPMQRQPLSMSRWSSMATSSRHVGLGPPAVRTCTRQGHRRGPKGAASLEDYSDLPNVMRSCVHAIPHET
jgi:hypothetical protein